MNKSNAKQGEATLQWWQLSLLGVAAIIGTGFFLGSSIAIKMTGPSVIISYVLAAIGTYVVFDALAKMTAADPEKGSFRSYAKKAYGRWAGFSSGWVYWVSEMLIMGSQMTALSIFSRFWFPGVPLWVFATGYAILGIVVIFIGTKGFDRVENLFAVLKVAAILIFIILATAALFGLLNGTENTTQPRVSKIFEGLFIGGAKGLWSSLIFGFYAFGGIEIMGLLAMRLKRKRDAIKAGKVMLMMLTVIYIISIGLAVTMVSIKSFSTKKSPFVTALNNYDLPFVPHIFNGVLILAGFSTMVASLFAVTSILVTLAEDQDAPSFFAKKVKNKLALPAIGLTTVGVLVSIVLSLLMPGKIYEYFTTGAGLMLLYNWLFILVSSGRLIQLTFWDNVKRILGMLLILLAVSGTFFHHTSRPGMFVSLVFIVLIGCVTLIMNRIWKRTSDKQSRSNKGWKRLKTKH